MARPKKEDTGTPISLRISAQLYDRLKMAAELLDKPMHEVMRDAMRIGLEDLKRCNYDIASAVVERARAEVSGRENELALLAEKGSGYRAGPKKRAG